MKDKPQQDKTLNILDSIEEQQRKARECLSKMNQLVKIITEESLPICYAYDDSIIVSTGKAKQIFIDNLKEQAEKFRTSATMLFNIVIGFSNIAEKMKPEELKIYSKGESR